MNLYPLILAWKRMEWLALAAAAALAVIGILFIYSASYRQDDMQVTAMTLRQLVWVVLGMGVMLALAAADYRRVAAVAPVLYGASLLLLALVLGFGRTMYGATRWLNVFGIYLQPSEFAKIASILLLARYLAEPGRNFARPQVIALAALIVAVPMALVMRQPDLGTALTFAPMFLAMLFVGGMPIRYAIVLVFLGAVTAVPGWFLLSDYQRERILVFLDPSRDPLGSGWNSIQSSIAVGSGGLFGKGYLMGTQNVLGFLPRTVAPTDFIFSVIAEETGFVGSVTLLTLYAILLGGVVRAGIASRDKLGRLIATGVATLLFCHIFVNLAMTVGLMPITGLPLPLVSYGGSFMITATAGLGLAQSIYVRRVRR
ncbi:MAG: rod shape-determining protein RodA [Kiritimatiellae bacterium]|nr:rod shape-determining protein RodA [Kiritimatiellia bacterium]MDW8458200.1 rod shape-determining protein RodA [Verrucomicrobiota bacterium]